MESEKLKDERPLTRNSIGVGTRGPVWKLVRSFEPTCPECGGNMIHSTFANWAEWDWECVKCAYKCKGQK
jgi:tRNA(Ile2) C34 agmatinyltransferase TiaS